LAGEFQAAFDHVRIRPEWRELEPETGRFHWDRLDAALDQAAALDKPIVLGPIIDLRPESLPTWLDEWIGEPDVLETLLVNHVETVIDRTKQRVQEWLVCSRTNSSAMFGFGAEVRLRLTRTLLNAARAVAPTGRFGIELDRPWGDYARPGRPLQYPLVFADTLLRTDCRPDFLSLELAFGYSAGSFCRPLLAIWEILDEFGELDLPLDVTLFHPADGAAPDSGGFEGQTPELVQAERAERMMLVALAKEDVRRVTWGCHRDPHDGAPWPGSGLIDAEGHPRPALARLLNLKRRPA
jgi:hypothetical protein